MIESIFNIPVLFFLFGVFAMFIRSNLELPKGLIEGVTLYLMLAIGIKGGIALASDPITFATFEPTIIVVLGSILVATYVYAWASMYVRNETAAAIGATYGSNSTTTFVTAAAFLSSIDVAYGGAMVVALVLMETPAIIYGIYLASKEKAEGIKGALQQAFTDGTHLLLIASLFIGYITVFMTDNTDLLYGFVGGDIFTGALAFFLLAMGLKVGQALRGNIGEVLDWRLISMAAVLPWVNGLLGYVAGLSFGLAPGDLFLTTILMASSSYIVAPAIMEKAVPSAEVSKYLTMSIAITFPINVLLGLPFWWYMVQ
jgi:hypothetical protein